MVLLMYLFQFILRTPNTAKSLSQTTFILPGCNLRGHFLQVMSFLFISPRWNQMHSSLCISKTFILIMYRSLQFVTCGETWNNNVLSILGFSTEYLLDVREQVSIKTFCQRWQQIAFVVVLLHEVLCVACFLSKAVAEWQEGKLPICVDYSNW